MRTTHGRIPFTNAIDQAPSFDTVGLTLELATMLLAAGGGLGWLAARAAVGRYLRQIEPK